MTDIEKTFANMQNTSISFARSNGSVWLDNVIIKKHIEDLEKNYKELNDAAQAQKDNDPKGEIAQKRKDLTTLAKLGYRACRALCHIAKTTNDMVLLKEVDISETEFLKGNEKSILLIFNTVLSAVQANFAAMAPYNFTQVKMDTLKSGIKKFQDAPGTISVVLGNQKTATRSIKEIIEEAHTIFDLTDDAMEGALEDERFLEAWFEARKIKGRHNYRKVKEKTTDTK